MSSPSIEAAAREHQRLLHELYSATPDDLFHDLTQAVQAAQLSVHGIDHVAPGSAQRLERLAEHLDGCRRQALKLAQRLRAQSSVIGQQGLS